MENLDDDENIEDETPEEPVEETYTEREIVEDGITYRVVEDSSGKVVLKEALQDGETPPPPPSPAERIAQIEGENRDLKDQLAQTNSDLAALMELVLLQL